MKFKILQTFNKDGSFTIYHQNIQTLAIEMFKIHNGFSQVSFLDLFHNYNENNFLPSKPLLVQSQKV